MYNIEISYINDSGNEDLCWFKIKNLNDLYDLINSWLPDKNTKSLWIRILP